MKLVYSLLLLVSIQLNGQVVSSKDSLQFANYAQQYAQAAYDDSTLFQFAKVYTIDSTAIEYMYENKLDYRSIVSMVKLNGLSHDYGIYEVREKLLTMKRYLLSKKITDSLVFIKIVDQHTKKEDKQLMRGSFSATYKAGEHIITFNSGELLKINGIWKAVTGPKMQIDGWYQ